MNASSVMSSASMNASAMSSSSSSSSSFRSQASSSSTSFANSSSMSATNIWDRTYNNALPAADQPLPNMTVREYLERVGRDAEQRIMDKAASQNADLWAKFETMKAGLLAPPTSSSLNDYSENVASSNLQQQHVEKKPKTDCDYKVVLELIYMQDAVQQVEVKVGPRREAKVGRSRGQQFLPGQGISLYFDQEVSTTHGRFFLHSKTGRVCFEDLGSTNKTSVSTGEGTRVLDKSDPVALELGDTLYLGASTLRVVEVRECASSSSAAST